MRLLLDTCTFLWIVDDSKQLSPACRRLFSDADNEVYLSAVSAWEIAVKHSLGRLSLSCSPTQFVIGFRELHRILPLPLTEDAVLQVAKLPSHHRDPYDRMLVCQAIAEGLTILTPDPQIGRYPVRTHW